MVIIALIYQILKFIIIFC